MPGESETYERDRDRVQHVVGLVREEHQLQRCLRERGLEGVWDREAAGIQIPRDAAPSAAA